MYYIERVQTEWHMCLEKIVLEQTTVDSTNIANKIISKRRMYFLLFYIFGKVVFEFSTVREVNVCTVYTALWTCVRVAFSGLSKI